MKTADFRESTVPMPGEQERVARAQAAALLAERSGSGPRVQTKPIAISTPVRVSSAPQLHDSYPGSAGQMSEAPLDTGRLRLYIVLGVVGTAFLLIVLASLSALFAHP